MSQYCNDLKQPVGRPLLDWAPPAFPPHEPMHGRTCRLESLSPERHSADLYNAYSLDLEGGMWTYLPIGPFANRTAHDQWIADIFVQKDPQFYAIVDTATQNAVGVASLMRIDPKNGCLEVGFLAFSPLLQKTTAATEAMFLMMRRAFELGYRRYEWKCDALNYPSRAAAERFGFTFEGVFRQAVVVKGRNRDTAWYSILDSEWPSRKLAFEKWLDPGNFDASGKQLTKLRAQGQ